MPKCSRRPEQRGGTRRERRRSVCRFARAGGSSIFAKILPPVARIPVANGSVAEPTTHACYVSDAAKRMRLVPAFAVRRGSRPAVARCSLGSPRSASRAEPDEQVCIGGGGRCADGERQRPLLTRSAPRPATLMCSSRSSEPAAQQSPQIHQRRFPRLIVRCRRIVGRDRDALHVIAHSAIDESTQLID